MSEEKFTIAVIGTGAIGVSMISNLINDFCKAKINNIRIIACEEREISGPGIVYQPDHDSIILNRTANNMSVLSTDKNHFANWLIENRYPSSILDSYLPRQIFGEYLKSTLKKTIEDALEFNIELELIQNSVESIIPNKEQYYLTAGNKQYDINRIILCVGNLRSNRYIDLLGGKNYFHTPYPTNKITHLRNSKKSIGIIGSRLSAMDTVISLKNMGYKGAITLLSRQGYLPSVMFKQKKVPLRYCTEAKISYLKSKTGGNLSYRTVLRLVLKELSIGCGYQFSVKYQKPKNANAVEIFKRDLKNEMKNENGWQDSFVALNAVICELWNSLSDKDQKKFRQFDFSRFMALRVPIPKIIAKEVEYLFDSGQLNMISGLESIVYSNEMYSAKFKNGASKSFDIIINCTGPENNISETKVPLFISLKESGHITPHSLGGVNVNFYTNKAIHSDGISETGIFVVGNLTSGTHLFCSILEINTLFCKRVSETLLKEYIQVIA
jgi:uncharacterized NAD(P)/FAD-binding protein YdhS